MSSKLRVVLVTTLLIISALGATAKFSLPSEAAPSSRFTIPYPVYQFASWQGNGIGMCQGSTFCNPTDAFIQQSYMATGSMIFPWNGVGYANWCGGANTTSTDISNYVPGSGNSIYNSQVAGAIVKYQMPYFIEEPVDGYGNCPGWAAAARTEYPDLITYNSLGQRITSPGIDANDGQGSYVRVDDLNFGKQIYNDLVNIKNNVKSTNPALLQYWNGIDISSVAADWGGYPSRLGGHFPNFMLGPASVINFANSVFCTSQCSTLISLANGGPSNIPQIYSILTQGCYGLTSPPTSGVCGGGLSYQFSKFTNTEQVLGITYAAYNFSQNYGSVGHPFVVATAYDSLSVLPSQYPAPYNTPYIQSLNLLQNYAISGQATVEGSSSPTSNTVSADIGYCKNNARYGNLGGYLAAASGGSHAAQYIKNDMYYTATCAGTSMMEISSWGYSPSSPGWSTMYGFGQLLNRMKNLGNSFSTTSLSANDPSTGATLLTGNGMNLAWFYTNRTGTETASANIPLSSNGNWIAISALDWSVVGSGTGSAAALSVSIPARGWNPVYIISRPADQQVAYTNMALTGQTSNGILTTYSVNAPYQFSTWMIAASARSPATVGSSNTGLIPQFSSLSALNKTTIGMSWSGSAWQSLTQPGWYYDSANGLVYIHFLGDNSVSVSLAFTPVSTTTSSSSTSTTPSQTSTLSSSSSSTSTTSTAPSSTSTSTTSTTQTTTSSSTSSMTKSEGSSTKQHTTTQSTSSSTSSTSTSLPTVTTTTTTTVISNTANTAPSEKSTTSSSSTTATASTSTNTRNPFPSSISTTTTSTFNLTPIQPVGDFSITGSGTSGTVVQGGTISFSISVNALSGSMLPVLLTTSGSPQGSSVLLSRDSGTFDFDAGVTVATSITTPPGLYFIEVYGTSGTTVRTYVYQLVVNSTGAKANYVLDLSTPLASSGTTNPSPGSYVFPAYQTVKVTASPAQGFALSYWVVNGQKMGNGTTLSFTMAVDTAIEAVFTAANPQFLLGNTITIERQGLGNVSVDGSQYSLPVTFSWKVGAQHHISVATFVNSRSDAREVFVGWSGTLNSSSPSIDMTVTAPATILASYKSQELVNLLFVGNDGARILPSYIALSGPNGLLELQGRYSVWLDSGESYTLVRTIWMGQVVAADHPRFIVRGLGSVTFPLTLVKQVVKVNDIFGLPIAGASVELILGNQVQLSQSTDGTGQAEFSLVPGQYSVRVSYLGFSDTLSDVFLGTKALNVTVALSYPLLIVIPIIVLIVALLRLIRIHRRNEIKLYYDKMLRT